MCENYLNRTRHRVATSVAYRDQAETVALHYGDA